MSKILDKKISNHIFFQVIINLILFIILPFVVERNWMTWSGELLLYVVAGVLLVPICLMGNLVVKHIGRYQYVLSMVLVFLLYRNLPIYITNFYDILRPNVDLPPLLPIAELKAVPKLIIPFMLVAIIALAQSTVVLFKERKQIKREKLEAELAMLKSQINPHFFFNSLNSIYHLTLTKDDKAPEAVIRLSDMMRYVLTDARAEKVSLKKEVDYLNRYVQLQSSRIPKYTKLDYKVDIDDETVEIAPLLLISFVENAFKYGISTNYETQILVHLTVKEKELQLLVKNDIHNNLQNTYGTSCGIDNVKKRLEGIYSEKYELKVEEDDSHFVVNLMIAL